MSQRYNNHRGNQQPFYQNNNMTNINMQYINLLLEKQNFMLSKIDHIETISLNTLKDNNIMKSHIEMLEDKTKMLTDQLEILTEYNKEHKNDNKYDKYIDNEIDKDIYDEKYDEKDDEKYDDKDKTNFDNNIFIPKQKKKHGILINVQNEHSTSHINPFELILGHLNKLGKPKEKEQEIDSDDEYDGNEHIYDENEKIEYDENFIELNNPLNNINDIIEMGLKYRELIQKIKKTNLLDNQINIKENSLIYDIYELDGKKYSINLEIVSRLINPLMKLSKMIGMKKVKDDMFDMIIYYLQGFEKKNKNMLHSVIEGPPGVGKTKLGKIIAQIYCALGIILSSKFKYVKATDLIGDHVGATKHMTQNAIDEADGGVLFIDEAYALSSNEHKDPYGKECIDTLNFNLSENKKKLIVIIAGYPDYLDKYFFSYNPGLQRRFPFRFSIDSYSPEELKDIFIDKLKRFRWKLDKNITMDKLNDFFTKNKEEFPNFGGDIENLFKSCQFSHSRRMIGKHPNLRGKLTFEDITNGLEKFKKNKRQDDKKTKYSYMYV